MADKYKLINRELVLRNQSLKETIKSLNVEIQTLKAEHIEINQENMKLLKEIDNYKDIKAKLLIYTSDLSYNLAKIFTLIYPQRYSNGPTVETSTNENLQQSFISNITNRSTLRQSNNIIAENYYSTQLESTENNEISINNTQVFSNSCNTASQRRNTDTETSFQQNQQSLITENDKNSSILHVTKRKIRKSFTRKPVEVEQIISPKTMNFCSASSESDSVDEIIENHSNSSGTLKQTLRMSTIAEEGNSSSDHNTIVNNYSKRSFKNRSRIEKENTTLVRNSEVPPEMSVIQTKSEPFVINSVNDNMTIINVPCSTPYQKKRSFSSYLDDDSFISLQNSKVIIKKLNLKNLKQIGIKLNQYESNRKCFNENSNDKQIKRSRIKEEEKNKRTKNKNKEIDFDQKRSCGRKIRTRSTVKSFTEPTLKMKLRR